MSRSSWPESPWTGAWRTISRTTGAAHCMWTRAASRSAARMTGRRPCPARSASATTRCTTGRVPVRRTMRTRASRRTCSSTRRPRTCWTRRAASRPAARDGVLHPTVKPVALMRWLVRLAVPRDGLVVEPFAGSGATLQACVMEGVRCEAAEMDADYIRLIRERMGRDMQTGLF
ncbi:DNA methyltransferase [Bifidobacterium catenulatum subsp. kashiwanohense]|uniref:DNA methyltransferase n=1 Tax=Bifidobacterium catenulatum TaxID=1686 RepID=UPI003A1DD350